MIQTTIIIPAWNEENGLPIVLNKTLNVIDDTYEVLVVDDGSTDGTSDAASKFNCRVVKHEVNNGKGQALRTGIKEAKGAKIIWIDADGSYPSEIIPQINNALDNYNIVVCSRKLGRCNIPKINRIGNWIFSFSIRSIYGFKANDPCTGLYAGWKSYLEKMDLTSNRFAIEPEISIKTGRMKLKTLDIPIEYQMRIGISKLGVIRVGLEDSLVILKYIFWRGRG